MWGSHVCSQELIAMHNYIIESLVPWAIPWYKNHNVWISLSITITVSLCLFKLLWSLAVSSIVAACLSLSPMVAGCLSMSLPVPWSCCVSLTVTHRCWLSLLVLGHGVAACLSLSLPELLHVSHCLFQWKICSNSLGPGETASNHSNRHRVTVIILLNDIHTLWFLYIKV